MNKNQTPDYDCIVVGSGIAGLVAARNLKRSGHKVLVLEAQDYVGGRMVGKRLESGQWIDQGGQWVGPTQDRFLKLLDEYGIRRFTSPVTGKKVLIFNGKRYEFDGFFQGHYEGERPDVSEEEWKDATQAWEKFAKLSANLSDKYPFHDKNNKELDSQTFESWIRANTHTEFGYWYFAYMGRAAGFSGPAEPNQVSLLHFLWGQKVAAQADAPEADLIHGGAGQLPALIAKELADNIHISEPVLSIEHDTHGVTVKSAKTSYTAKYTILAMPPHLAGRIHYSPALPAERDQLTQRVPMGTCAKLLISYNKPFWREKGLAGIALGNNEWIELCADSSDPESGVGVIASFVVGDRYVKWRKLSDAERKSAVLNDLAKFFGQEALTPTTYEEVDWPGKPWAGGGYAAYMTPGTWTSLGHALVEPVGRIYWAGTEMAERWAGFFEGAIRTAETAADSIHAHLAK